MKRFFVLYVVILALVACVPTTQSPNYPVSAGQSWEIKGTFGTESLTFNFKLADLVKAFGGRAIIFENDLPGQPYGAGFCVPGKYCPSRKSYPAIGFFYDTQANDLVAQVLADPDGKESYFCWLERIPTPFVSATGRSFKGSDTDFLQSSGQKTYQRFGECTFQLIK